MPRKPTEAAETTKAMESKTSAKKTVTRRTKKAVDPVAPVWEHVATRAYYIHLDEGGDAIENWLRAERELTTV